MNIEIRIKDLIKDIGYTENYFKKILRKNNISNRYLLDRDDLVKLLKVPIVSNKSYELRIYLNKMLDINPTSVAMQ